jgi:hypothetical protein
MGELQKIEEASQRTSAYVPSTDREKNRATGEPAPLIDVKVVKPPEGNSKSSGRGGHVPAASTDLDVVTKIGEYKQCQPDKTPRTRK